MTRIPFPTPTSDELARDSALDDETAAEHSLELIKRLNVVYGRDKATKKVLTQLADHQIGIRQRARERHQEAECRRVAAQDEEEIIAQSL